MMDPAQFDAGRVRPLVTVLDTLRRRLDPDGFDAAMFSLDTVVADLGYGDLRALPGSVAWIDRLRRESKRIGVVASGEYAENALNLAGIADRADVVVAGSKADGRLRRALQELDVEADRAVAVLTTADEIGAARAEGIELAIGLARGPAKPEELRRAGAVTIVADLQELL